MVCVRIWEILRHLALNICLRHHARVVISAPIIFTLLSLSVVLMQLVDLLSDLRRFSSIERADIVFTLSQVGLILEIILDDHDVILAFWGEFLVIHKAGKRRTLMLTAAKKLLMADWTQKRRLLSTHVQIWGSHAVSVCSNRVIFVMILINIKGTFVEVRSLGCWHSDWTRTQVIVCCDWIRRERHPALLKRLGLVRWSHHWLALLLRGSLHVLVHALLRRLKQRFFLTLGCLQLTDFLSWGFKT